MSSVLVHRIIAALLVVSFIASYIPVMPVTSAEATVTKATTTTTTTTTTKDNLTLMQYFEWYLPADGNHWKRLENDAKNLRDVGINGVWLPPASKGASGSDVGYGVYDWYDLGEFDQKGTVRTKYGTKWELKSAISALKANNVQVFADIVMNHKASADGTESVTAVEVDRKNRNVDRSGPYQVQVHTRFWFPGRGDKYSDFKWNWTHFNGSDWDVNSNSNKIFRYQGKKWDEEVDKENGNYDYLMFADLDFDNQEVVNEMTNWGTWLVNELDLDGFRLDAVKHIKFDFMKNWVTNVRKSTGKPLFTFGEYWSGNTQLLMNYLTKTEETFSILDVDLHHRFENAGKANGNYDLSTLLGNTITDLKPKKSMTFVDNHDTQPGQALQSWVAEWFKPQSYAFILTREEGVPIVFYGDYYGIPNNNIQGMKQKIDPLIKARKQFAYGKQNDYLDNADIVGWTREGVADRPLSGLATVISDNGSGTKRMFVGKQNAGETWYDFTGNRSDQVRIGADGWGQFPVNSRSVSVYVSKGDTASNDKTPPTNPQAAVITGATENSLSLSWTAATDNEGISGYEVYRDNTLVDTVSGTTFTDSNLKAGTNYSYKIVALDYSGNKSPGSTMVSGKTSPPGTNSVTIYYKKGYNTPHIHYKTPNAQWTNAPGQAIPAAEIPGYHKITIPLGSPGRLEACFNDGSNNWDSNNGSNYFFNPGVYTFVPGGSGKQGTIKAGEPTGGSADTVPPTAPGQPTQVNRTSQSMTLSWSAAQDNVAVKSYEIFRNQVKVGTSESTSFTDSGLTAATAYRYSIKAVDTSNNISGFSPTATLTTAEASNNNNNEPKPNTVTIYYKKGFNNPNIHYQLGTTWTPLPGVPMAPSEFNGYHKIEVNLGSNSETMACFNDGAGKWDSNQMKNYRFTAGVSTYIPSTTGGSGKIVAGAPGPVADTLAPSQPANLRMSQNTTQTIQLTWQASTDNTGVTGYIIFRNKVRIGTSAATQYLDRGLQPGTNYQYEVRAIDAAGNVSSSSSSLSAVTRNAVTNQPAIVLVKGKQIFVNGKLLQTSVEPRVIRGRINVPFKALFESLGANVTWNANTRTLRATRTGVDLTMQVNRNTATLNGRTMQLDSVPFIQRGTTFVPLRFVADTLGASIAYQP